MALKTGIGLYKGLAYKPGFMVLKSIIRMKMACTGMKVISIKILYVNNSTRQTILFFLQACHEPIVTHFEYSHILSIHTQEEGGIYDS